MKVSSKPSSDFAFCNKLLAVFRGAYGECLFELFRELVDIGISDSFGNLTRADRKVVEQSLSNRHAFANDVTADRCAKVFAELMGEMAAGHARNLSQFI